VQRDATGREDRALEQAPAALETGEMSTSFKELVLSYLRAGKPARGTQDTYLSTVKK